MKSPKIEFFHVDHFFGTKQIFGPKKNGTQKKASRPYAADLKTSIFGNRSKKMRKKMLMIFRGVWDF